MMKKISVFLLFIFISTACAASDTQNRNTAVVEEAKKEYAAFLQKLNALNKQYGQVTGEVKKIVKEQGVPVWDDKEGKFKISRDVDFSDNGSVYETENEIKIGLERPGLKKESIHITIEDGKTLHIHALKKVTDPGQPDEVINETYDLPVFVTDSKPKAKYEDGILTITVQKPAISQKTVAVSVQ